MKPKTVGSLRHPKALTWGRCEVLTGRQITPVVLGKPQDELREGGGFPLVTFPIFSSEPPRVSLTPAPVVWAAPGEAPPELLCLASHFYPVEGLKVEWEVRGGPEGSSRTAEGKTWLSTIRHHSDGSVSQAGHLQPPPVSAKQHGVRYACRVHHPSLPASGRSAVVTLEVAGNRLGNL